MRPTYLTKFVSLFRPIAAFYIETSHLICTANQITGFHIKCNTGLKWGNKQRVVNVFRLTKR